MKAPAATATRTFSFDPADLAESALQAQLLRRCRRSMGHDINNAVQALQSGLEILSKSLQPGAVHRVEPAECVPLLKQQLVNLQYTLGRLLNEVAPAPAPAAAFDFVELVRETLLFLSHETAISRAKLELPAQVMVLARRTVVRRALLSCILDALDDIELHGSLLLGVTQAHSTSTLELRVITGTPAAGRRQRLSEILERLLAPENASIALADLADGYAIVLQLANLPPPSERTIDVAAAADASSHHAAPRVLIVDGHRDSADTLALLLELEGYGAKAVYTSAQALAIVAEFRPTLVLLDLEQPDMAGAATVQRLREASRHESAIVALSGDAAGRRREAAAAHFDAELAKPVEPAALRELMARLPRR